jgi:flagella synthesis protein FlgN
MSVPPPLLEQLRQELGAFVGILDDESRALASGNIEQLARVIENKNRCAASTASAWSLAINWLRGQSTGRLNQGLEVPAEIMPHWQDILTLARRAETLNQDNGHSIDALLQRTRGAIEVLQTAARPVHLYGADGHFLDIPGQGHTLDKV